MILWTSFAAFTSLNPFFASFAFPYPLKTSENRTVFCSQGVEKCKTDHIQLQQHSIFILFHFIFTFFFLNRSPLITKDLFMDLHTSLHYILN